MLAEVVLTSSAEVPPPLRLLYASLEDFMPELRSTG
jgi:hypothetical protein